MKVTKKSSKNKLPKPGIGNTNSRRVKLLEKSNSPINSNSLNNLNLDSIVNASDGLLPESGSSREVDGPAPMKMKRNTRRDAKSSSKKSSNNENQRTPTGEYSGGDNRKQLADQKLDLEGRVNDMIESDKSENKKRKFSNISSGGSHGEKNKASTRSMDVKPISKSKKQRKEEIQGNSTTTCNNLDKDIESPRSEERTTASDNEHHFDVTPISDVSPSTPPPMRGNRMAPIGSKKKKSKNKRKHEGKQSDTSDLSTAELENNPKAQHSALSDLGEEAMSDNDGIHGTGDGVDIIPQDLRCICRDLHEDYYGVLLPTKNQIIGINGYLKLAVLEGAVDVTGYKMGATTDTDISYVEMCSVNPSSLYYIKDSTTFSSLNRDGLILKISNIFNSSKEAIKELLKETDEIFSCVLLRKINSVAGPLLRRLNVMDGLLNRPIFYTKPFRKSIIDTSRWKTKVDDIENEMNLKTGVCNCSIMICGGADVGKSSLGRYIINRLLGTRKTVFYLDFDCGQTEFTPPSLMSLVKVTKPILGAPFSHLEKPVKSYCVGHISPKNVPTEYIKLITLLFQEYHSNCFSLGPLVINMPGWMRGLGLQLAIDCIRITNPCYVIQINSTEKEKLNSPHDLCDEYIAYEAGWRTDPGHQSLKKSLEDHIRHYIVLNTPGIDKSKNTSLKKGKSIFTREQNITAYFSNLYQSNLNKYIASGGDYFTWIPPPISTLLPYIVRWKDVALHVMQENIPIDVMLFSFNLALVSLAHADPELIQIQDEDSDMPKFLIDQPIAEHIGFGIIRNIDPEKKLFYILTPEPVECWKEVNVLLKGSVQLPISYLLEDEWSNKPYYCVDYVSVASKGAGVMKPRCNLKRRPSRLKNGNNTT